MKKVVALLAAAFFTTASAEPIFYPSPVGIVLSVGQLIYNSNSTQEQLVTVKSYGKDEAEARKHGFQLAVEYVVGQLILSERVVQQKNVERNEIIQYSAGYVSRYNIKSKEVSKDVVIVMDVWVKPSKIHERLTANSEDKSQIDGRNLSAQMQTVVARAVNGEKAIKAVLNDYPRFAFTVANRDVAVERLSGNRMVMFVPVIVKWNPKFIQSLGEVLQATDEQIAMKQRKNGYRLVARMDGFIYSRTYDVWTQDFNRYTAMNETLSKFAVRVDIKDNLGNALASKCVEPMQELTKFLDNQIIVDGRANYEDTIVLENITAEDMEQAQQLTITVIDRCKPLQFVRR